VTSVVAQTFNATAEKSQDFEGLTTAEIVMWALENYNPRVGVVCSFQAECVPAAGGGKIRILRSAGCT
jgi:uncharacterized protein YijF (DUF1287 family)